MGDHQTNHDHDTAVDELGTDLMPDICTSCHVGEAEGDSPLCRYCWQAAGEPSGLSELHRFVARCMHQLERRLMPTEISDPPKPAVLRVLDNLEEALEAMDRAWGASLDLDRQDAALILDALTEARQEIARGQLYAAALKETPPDGQD